MTLLERLKADRLAAMKAREMRKRDLLGTVIAAAAKDTKEPGDALVTKTLRGFMKSLDETIALLAKAGKDSGPQAAEKALLEPYLPRALDEATLRAEIAAVVADLPEPSPRAMGQVMAALKARHGEAFDARAASGLVRAALEERSAETG